MKQILVYGDSLSWGIIPGTRQRLTFEKRWPGVLETALNMGGNKVRVIENCLNGRRTVWDDPFKAGRNGLQGLPQLLEVHSPLDLVILMLGTNDFQAVHNNFAIQATQGIAAIIQAIRSAPIEPGMPVPPTLLVAPPPILRPTGPMQDKFIDAEKKCLGLADKFAALSRELDCFFFDSGTVIVTSSVDGVHIDAGGHLALGQALVPEVEAILVR